MKPAWDKLSEEFKDSKSAGVYDVDCTADGKDLCEEVGVKGYPTIKWGDPTSKSDMKDYDGGRDYDALKKFAEENLGPTCGPDSLDACSDEDRKTMEGILAKSDEEFNAEFDKLKKKLDSSQKALDKKQKKFKQKEVDFKEWKAEFHSEDDIFEQEKKKFEKKVDKATKQEKAKMAEKEKKNKKMKDQLHQKSSAIEAEKTKLDKEAEDLAEEVKTSGFNLMKIVKKKKGASKSEL